MSFSEIASRANASMLRVFGESINYQPASGIADPIEVTAVWSDNEKQMPPGVRATAWFLESALNGEVVSKNDIVRRDGYSYRVVGVPGVDGPYFQRDGNGGITVYLKQTNHAA